MPLTSGTSLGPYEILSPAGAGGMGEVYRARDSRLNREVAVKVLPAVLSRDPDRLRRFQQEAQAAAALNHPNILAIYDFGEREGAPYIVSELLEGETLRERLRPGALPVRKATEYVLQIARGLAAAHEKGIVHRDLKPENIFLTKDGRVKILDFGLAKLTRPAEYEAGDSPTLPDRTDPGVVMGTAGYMSPEQVKGQPADHRSDLFSFGAVLYEMLSGKRAFRGETAVETMSAILKEDPPELTETNRNIPPALERIVRHCLEKNPQERFQSARDVAFDLESLSGISTTSAALKPRQVSRLKGFLAPSLAAVVLIAAGYLAGHRGNKTAAPVFHRLTFQRGSVGQALFSPDGHTVVYSAAWNGNPIEVYSTRSEFPEPHALGLTGYDLFAISATNELALGQKTERDTTLARAPLLGGTPHAALEHISTATWAPDGTLVVVHVVGGKWRLEYPPGKVWCETSGYISFARLSPKGDRIAFMDHPYWPDSRGSVAVVDLNGKKQTLTQEYGDEGGLAWSSKGDEIWYTATATGSDRSLFAVDLAGRERPVFSIPGAVTLHDIASDGRVLLSSVQEQVGILGRRPSDTKETDFTWFEATFLQDISSDGQWLLIDEQGQLGGANYSVGMRKLDGSPVVLLGKGDARSFSPDGKWVVATLAGAHPEMILLPTGAGEPKHIPTPGVERYGFSAAFSPDGRRLSYSGAEAGHGLRTYVQDLDGGKPRPVTPEGVEANVPSPDGKFLAGTTPEGQLAIYPLDGGSARVVPGSLRDCSPMRWTKDGLSLHVRCGAMPAKLYRVEVASGKNQLVRELAPADPAGISVIYQVVVSPDGQTYAYGFIRRLDTLYVVEGLK